MLILSLRWFSRFKISWKVCVWERLLFGREGRAAEFERANHPFDGVTEYRSERDVVHLVSNKKYRNSGRGRCVVSSVVKHADDTVSSSEEEFCPNTFRHSYI